MDADDGEPMVVQLNLDNEYVRRIVEAPPEVFARWIVQQHRRGEFEYCMEQIGSLSKFRRSRVVRALVRMFRAGFRSGRSCSRDLLRLTDAEREAVETAAREAEAHQQAKRAATLRGLLERL